MLPLYNVGNINAFRIFCRGSIFYNTQKMVCNITPPKKVQFNIMNSMMLKQKMEKQIFDESLNLLRNNVSAPLPNFPNEQCG